MGKKKEPKLKKSALEIRNEIKNYIKNERDTILLKWKCLEQAVQTEDAEREKAGKSLLFAKTNKVPDNVRKFIGSVKYGIKKLTAGKGGTIPSIAKQLLIYWDSEKSRTLSFRDLKNFVNNLGIDMPDQGIQDVINYYKSKKDNNKMDYKLFLNDLKQGEPDLINFDPKNPLLEIKAEDRFKDQSDFYANMPELVKQYIHAIQYWVGNKMRVEGGTPWQHIRDIFLKHDFNFSFGIDPQELLYASRKHMYLDISPEQANAIIKYYDIDKKGEIYYNKIVDDVCIGVKPILAFTELTEKEIKEEKDKQKTNPFIPKPFKSRNCRVLESLKRTIKNNLNKKVNISGGIWIDYLREAFVAWDPRALGKLGRWDHVVGVFKRLGIKITKDEAQALIVLFDKDKTGELVYEEFIKEIGSEDFHFMGDNAPALRKLEEPATARTPPEIRKLIKIIFLATEAYSRKSKGLLNPRDVLHGTCLRYDKDKSGRLSYEDLQGVMRDLSCSISSSELRTLLLWFDTNGSSKFDYNELTRHLFGDDIMTRALVIPKSSKHAAAILTAASYDTNATIKSTSVLKERPQSATFGDSSSNFNSNRPQSTGSFNKRYETTKNLDDTNGISRNPFMSNAFPSTIGNSGVSQWKSATRASMEDALIPKPKNLKIIDKDLQKAKKKARIQMILQEREQVTDKLDSIEAQRKQLLHEHRLRQEAKNKKPAKLFGYAATFQNQQQEEQQKDA